MFVFIPIELFQLISTNTFPAFKKANKRCPLPYNVIGEKSQQKINNLFLYVQTLVGFGITGIPERHPSITKTLTGYDEFNGFYQKNLQKTK
jgi:hypothetical protein